jgi:hypothetical protein
VLVDNASAMKLYCYFTPAYGELFSQYFLPSLHSDEYELVTSNGVFDGPFSNYDSAAWPILTREKVKFIIEAVQANWNQYFVFSDPDVQFFSSTKTELLELSCDIDIAFQVANPQGGVCTGFFISVGNNRTLRLWEHAHDLIDTERDDQDAVNILLNPETFILSPRRRVLGARGGSLGRAISRRGLNTHRVRWRYLPLSRFYLPGAIDGRVWTSAVNLEVPDAILMHHASWVIGQSDKRAQLQCVKYIVAARRLGSDGIA